MIDSFFDHYHLVASLGKEVSQVAIRNEHNVSSVLWTSSYPTWPQVPITVAVVAAE